MTNHEERKALHITKDAKNNVFVDCDIEGVKNEGQGTQMFRTRIYAFREKHPSLWKGGFVTLFFTIIGGIVKLILF